METLGESLLRHRRRKGLTQKQVAATVGVNRRTIENWETGKSWPRADRLTVLLQFYNVPEDEWADAMKGCSP